MTEQIEEVLEIENPVETEELHEDIIDETDTEEDSEEETTENAAEEAEPEKELTEKAKKAIFYQKRKRNAAEHKANLAERKAEELQRKIQEYEAKLVTPVEIPPFPDSFDDNYEQKIKERDKAIALKAQQEAIEQQKKQFERQKELESTYEREKKVRNLQDTFYKNAETAGYDSNKLSDAADMVASYGVSGDLALALLEDEKGPDMVMYLSKNPVKLQELVKASPVKAGLMLSEIRSKKIQAKVTKAPNPPTRVVGKPVGVEKSGVTGYSFD